jgi:MFS family permease
MTAIGFPSYQALLPELVPREDLLGAISLSSAQWNLGRVVGPALAGIVIHWFGYSAAFTVNAASFGAVILALMLVRLAPHIASTDDTGLWARIKIGIKAARDEPGCRAAILTISIVALTASPFIALIPAVAQVVLHGDAGTTSALVTAQGVGAVIGALAVPVVAEKIGRRRTLMGCLALVPIALIFYAAAPTVPTAIIALAIVGGTYIGMLSGLMTVVQLRAPDALRGRILSIYMMALGTIYPIGAIIQGALGDHFGLRWVMAAANVLLLAVLALLAVLRPRAVDALTAE